jgi:hypothetical protein
MVERIVGRPLDEIGVQWSAMQRHLLDLGDEVLRAS